MKTGETPNYNANDRRSLTSSSYTVLIYIGAVNIRCVRTLGLAPWAHACGSVTIHWRDANNVDRFENVQENYIEILDNTEIDSTEIEILKN